jgi:hypothetical protein
MYVKMVYFGVFPHFLWSDVLFFAFFSGLGFFLWFFVFWFVWFLVPVVFLSYFWGIGLCARHDVFMFSCF